MPTSTTENVEFVIHLTTKMFRKSCRVLRNLNLNISSYTIFWIYSLIPRPSLLSGFCCFFFLFACCVSVMLFFLLLFVCLVCLAFSGLQLSNIVNMNQKEWAWEHATGTLALL